MRSTAVPASRAVSVSRTRRSPRAVAAPVADDAAAAAKPKRLGRPRRKSILVVLLVLVLIGLCLFFYMQNQSAQRKIRLLSNPQESARIEAEALVAKVKKLVDLPDETPTVATVTDAAKLKTQPFFARAENGDKVLIYNNAKKAYLYRASTNQIVEIAPINLGQTAGESIEQPKSSIPTPAPAPKPQGR